MAALAGELCALSEEARGPGAGAIGLHPRDEPWGDVTCHLRGLALKAHHCSKVRTCSVAYHLFQLLVK